MTDIAARLAVSQALEAAEWTGHAEDPFRRRKHTSGASWVITTESGSCCVSLPGGVCVDFRNTVPDQVVLAACFAASGQLNPTQGRVELEQRDAWLGWLEAAGLDNWEGVDVAREMRDEHEESTR